MRFAPRTILVFTGLLIFYLTYIYLNASYKFEGDEPRYLRYAENLLHGFYANAEDPEFLNGPGYPIFLMPFVGFGTSLSVIRLANAFLMIGGVVFFYLTLRRYLPEKAALLFALLMGLYPFTWYTLLGAYPEALSILFCTGFIYFFCRAAGEKKWFSKDVFWAIFMLGMLVLTKVIFAYVVSVLILLGVVIWLVFRLPIARQVTVIGAGAYLLCSPYLFYTYQLTGQTLYWSTAGGPILYFRASPHKAGMGTWFPDRKVWNPEKYAYPDEVNLEDLSNQHLDFFKTLTYPSRDTNSVNFERDQIFRAKAAEMMEEHPMAYLRNTIASFSRLFFEFPLGHRVEKFATIKNVFINMFLLVISVLFIYPALKAWRIIPPELWTLVLFLLIFIGGSTLGDARIRYLIPVLPIFLFFIAFVFYNVLEIKIKTR